MVLEVQRFIIVFLMVLYFALPTEGGGYGQQYVDKTAKSPTPKEEPVIDAKPSKPKKEPVIDAKPSKPKKEPVIDAKPSKPKKEPAVEAKPAKQEEEPELDAKPAKQEEEPELDAKPAKQGEEPELDAKPAKQEEEPELDSINAKEEEEPELDAKPAKQQEEPELEAKPAKQQEEPELDAKPAKQQEEPELDAKPAKQQEEPGLDAKRSTPEAESDVSSLLSYLAENFNLIAQLDELLQTGLEGYKNLTLKSDPTEMTAEDNSFAAPGNSSSLESEELGNEDQSTLLNIDEQTEDDLQSMIVRSKPRDSKKSGDLAETLGQAKAAVGENDFKHLPEIDKSTWYEDLQILLESVGGVDVTKGQSPILIVYGDTAFPIITAEPKNANDGGGAAIAGGSRFGKGRVVAFAHEKVTHANFGDPEKLGITANGNERLFLNSLSWVLGGKPSKGAKKTITVFSQMNETSNEELLAFISDNGYTANAVEDFDTTKLNMESDGMVIPNIGLISLDQLDQLPKYVEQGGGVLVTNTQSQNIDQSNSFLGQMGMSWIDPLVFQGHCRGVLDGNWIFDTEMFFHENSHAGIIARMIIKSIQSFTPFQTAEARTFADTLKYAILNTEAKYITWLNPLKSSLKSLGDIIPSEQSLVFPTAMTIFQTKLESLFFSYILSPEKIVEHPSASTFSGSVDNSRLKELSNNHVLEIPVQNPKNEKTVFAPKSTGYPPYGFSTFLYAPAGSKVSIEFLGDVQVQKFNVIIGCHRDDATSLEYWSRYPIIAIYPAFSGDSADLASPFGGLIYLNDIKIRSTNATITSFTVQITGAITTPSFVLGKTSLKDWTDTIRHIKSPWGEFASDRIILSIPGDLAEQVDHPEDVLEFWDSAVDALSDLVGIPLNENAHRIAFDVQLTKGTMHSGNPVIAFMHHASSSVNLTVLKSNDFETYAFFHELGRNLQGLHGKSWTLEGGTEVSNNLFSLYVINVLNGYSLEDSQRKDVFQPGERKRLVNEYIKGGLQYKLHYLKNKELCLLPYYQLLKRFGWDAFKRVFRAYGAIPKDKLPYLERKKIDKWVTLFSQTVNQSLASFYKSWGVPVSAEAEEEISDLPESDMNMKDLLDDDFS